MEAEAEKEQQNVPTAIIQLVRQNYVNVCVCECVYVWMCVWPDVPV